MAELLPNGCTRLVDDADFGLYFQVKLTATDGSMTGLVEFDRMGIRKNFYVTVIDLVSNAKSNFNKKEVKKKFLCL